MATIVTSPAELRSALSSAQPGDVIQLATATYSGEYTLSTPGVTLEALSGESPKFNGPPSPVAGEKPNWLKIAPSAQGAIVRDLSFERTGDIADAKAFNDFGIVISAPDVTVENCRLAGMTKGIQVEGKESRNATIVRCNIGPTYQSGIVFGTSYGVVRGALAAWNHIHDGYIEDAVQTLQRFDDEVNQETDVSNFGVIFYENIIDRCGENAIDLKGADLVVCEGNVITNIAGSNDGPLTGWEPDSPMAIMHGSGSCKGAICNVLVRNNDIQQSAGGVRVFAGWHVVHNFISDNNFSKAPPHEGTGILQQGDETRAAIKNNLVTGHGSADLDLEADSPEFINNPPFTGPGVALTETASAGSGDTLPLLDAGYFTDWFGRTDLPAEILYLRDERFEVWAVDYDHNAVMLDRATEWEKGDPVFWRSPSPIVGIQPADEATEPPEVTEPPPAQAQTVTLAVTLTATPEQVQAIRDAGSVEVIYGDEALLGIVEG